MPLQATSGAASYDAFGGGVPVEPNYIESVFQTWLYTGNGSTQTITNGIDLSTKGGLVWMKSRSDNTAHGLYDTARGATYDLVSNTSAAQTTQSTGLTAFNTTGFTIGALAKLNTSASTYVSWSIRKQPKFFDVVTYSGAASSQVISHNLGSVPGCIIVKRTDASDDWPVYHRSFPSGFGKLNLTNAFSSSFAQYIFGNDTTVVAPTSTQFTVGSDGSVNTSGATYVAYLFAHDAGGFGLTGTDNVISCGSFTGNATVNLGFEPQWLLVKSSSGASDWEIYDTMRGFSLTGMNYLMPNRSDAETAYTSQGVYPTATGFVNNAYWGGTCIYIAIRRGPMKVPTSGTSVLAIDTAGSTGDGLAPLYRSSFPPDLSWEKGVSSTVSWYWTPRLVSGTRLSSDSTAAEVSSASRTFDYQNGWQDGTVTNSAYYSWMFRRAPSVMDVVCYTGDGVSSRVISHNLSAQPEFIAIKRRNGTGDWTCVSKLASGDYVRGAGSSDSPGAGTPIFGFNSIGVASQTLDLTGYITSTGFRPSVLSQYSATNTNVSGSTYVAYLFATCAGVSKVGSYTGTGADQVINCGFTGGARFVLIKCTNDTFGWYVYDSARGITSSNDPYLFLNSTAAQVTSTNAVDTDSTGFKVTSTAPNGINYSGYNYIFLAIA